jgi:hypothetical protein
MRKFYFIFYQCGRTPVWARPLAFGLSVHDTLMCEFPPFLENVVDFFESQKLDGVYRPVHVVPVVGEILLFLKGPKHENFGSRFLTPSKPI